MNFLVGCREHHLLFEVNNSIFTIIYQSISNIILIYILFYLTFYQSLLSTNRLTYNRLLSIIKFNFFCLGGYSYHSLHYKIQCSCDPRLFIPGASSNLLGFIIFVTIQIHKCTATGILWTFAKQFFKLLIVQLKGTFLCSVLSNSLFLIVIQTNPVPFFIMFCSTSSFMIFFISFFSILIQIFTFYFIRISIFLYEEWNIRMTNLTKLEKILKVIIIIRNLPQSKVLSKRFSQIENLAIFSIIFF